MNIETLEDWNLIADGCGCCPMPSCPVPIQDCESAVIYLCGFSPADDAPFLPPTPAERNILYAGMNFTTALTYDGPLVVFSGAESCVHEFNPKARAAGGSCLGSIDYTYSDTSTEWYEEERENIANVLTHNDVANGIDIGNGLGVVGSSTTAFTSYDIDGDVTDSGSDTVPYTRFFRVVPNLQAGGSGTWTGSTLVYDSYDITGIPDTITTTLRFTDAFTLATARAALATVTPAEWPDEACSSNLVVTMAEDGIRILAATATVAKVQFQVPTSHTGSYFKVTFDVIQKPNGWDDTINDPEVEPPDPLPPGWEHPQIPDPEAPSRSIVAADITRTWTGPGTGPQSDDSWNIGEPYTIPIPTVAGTCVIGNIRFECYRSTRTGTRPQVTGESYEPPPPPP